MKNARKLLAVLVCFATVICLITGATAVSKDENAALTRNLELERMANSRGMSFDETEMITVYDHEGNPHVVANGTVKATIFDAEGNVVEDVFVPMHVPYVNTLRTIPAGGRVRTMRYTLQPNDGRVLLFGFENSRNGTGTTPGTRIRIDPWGSQDIGDNGRDVLLSPNLQNNFFNTTFPAIDPTDGWLVRGRSPLQYYYAEYVNTTGSSITLRLFIARYS
jgi:hypothetical protein